MTFNKTYIEFVGFNYYPLLGRHNSTPEQIIEKWRNCGLLDGLTGHWDMPENIALLYESQASQLLR